MMLDDGFFVMLDEELFSPSSDPIAVRKLPCSTSVSLALFLRVRYRFCGDTGCANTSGDVWSLHLSSVDELGSASSSKVNGSNFLSFRIPVWYSRKTG